MTGKCFTAIKLMLTLMCVLMLNLPATALAADGSDSALAFVRQNHLGDGLPWLGYQVASRTTTFTAIVQKVGTVKAQAIVQDELQHLQPAYQDQWNQNMAQAYSESFSSAEMRQLVIGNPPKPLADKFKSTQKDVSMSMKAKSEGLLKTYVSKALLSAMTKVSH
ncbi:MAG: hypothetical protein ACOH2R_25505 [Pseudomonas sp.]